MLAFIAQSFPKAGLAPLDDAFAFAQVQSINSYLCATVMSRMRTRAAAIAGRRENSFTDMKRKVPQTMAACFALIERNMIKGPWVMGEPTRFAIPICTRSHPGWRVMASISRPCRRSPITQAHGGAAGGAEGPGRRRAERVGFEFQTAKRSQSRGSMPGLYCIVSPKRGRREHRVRAAPAVSCAIRMKKRTRAYRYSRSSPAFPAQWVYGL